MRWTPIRTFQVILFIFMLIPGVNLYAQTENLVGASHYPELKKATPNKTTKQTFQQTSPVDTLNVPLIEDFAKSTGYPDPKLWSDNYAFINHQFTSRSVSIGVATLDAIDEQGDVYKHGNTNSFHADTLTSNPLRLNYPPSESFYYQAGGLGDKPEFSDSLTLQFYNSDSTRWERIWSIGVDDTIYVERDLRKNTTDSIILYQDNFRQVHLPITENNYLTDGFRFRWINYASISDHTNNPSIASNVDHWNIDFVRLDTARSYTDTTINDIAFVEPLKPLLNNYEAIPWNHFPEANAVEMDDSIYITYRNIGDKIWNVSREFVITDKMGNNAPYTFTGGTGDDIPPYTTETYPRSINYIFPNSNMDSALFEIKSYLITDTASARAPYRWNDTITHNQTFYNYYAYDDGTAENGYGINGEGSENAMVALRFHNYKNDTLQGLQIFFNQTLDSTSQPFQIMVWENDNGKPGKVIYSENGFTQTYDSGINDFHTYSIFNKIYLKEGDYFVGYKKFTTNMLNVGYDVNRNHKDKLYYFVDGQWRQSGYNGTVMIRPVLGDYIAPSNDTGPVDVSQTIEQPELNIYPNPARNHINIQIPGSNLTDYTARIFSIEGTLKKQIMQLNKTIPIQQLTPGVYILEIRNPNTGALAREKFIVSR